jgi:hypothetical protein
VRRTAALGTQWEQPGRHHDSSFAAAVAPWIPAGLPESEERSSSRSAARLQQLCGAGSDRRNAAGMPSDESAAYAVRSRVREPAKGGTGSACLGVQDRRAVPALHTPDSPASARQELIGCAESSEPPAPQLTAARPSNRAWPRPTLPRSRPTPRRCSLGRIRQEDARCGRSGRPGVLLGNSAAARRPEALRLSRRALPVTEAMTAGHPE